MNYALHNDPYCYPHSTVLKNRFDIQKQKDLEEVEVASFLARSRDGSPAGQFDYADYKSLHHHLFQDTYDWAGTPRSIRIGKGGNSFCYPEFINAEMERIFGVLTSENCLLGVSPANFATKAAHLLADINAVHPFRDGNGRTQLAFLVLLTPNAGLPFNDSFIEKDPVMNAMIASFAGNETPLATLILAIISQ